MLHENATFSEFMNYTHSQAIIPGVQPVEVYSDERKQMLIAEVKKDMFESPDIEAKIGELHPDTQVRLLTNSYALAMQLLLRHCSVKVEPQRKPEILISDKDAYSTYHYIHINKNGSPFAIVSKMIEEAGHSLRARYRKPDEDEGVHDYDIAQEFCAMICRRLADERSLTVRQGEALGTYVRWDGTDEAVQRQVIEFEDKLQRAQWLRMERLVYEINEEIRMIVAHHLGYSAAQKTKLEELPPLDVLLALPSKHIIQQYVQEEGVALN